MRAFLVSISIVTATFATLTMLARAQGVAEGRAQVAELYDAGPVDAAAVDRVVASDHAAPSRLVDVPPEPPATKPAPSLIDDALAIAGPVGRGALGGIACLAVAWLLARARDRWGWLRKGAAGNAAATVYAALATFGAVVAVGGSVGAGLTAVGGAMAAGMALGRDPATARREAADPGEEVPT